ncbi:MAG: hypothetical protein JO001_05100 [Alphaproteobacteria bacterium]|nr:hypothetical protein [Alphaproteobacteria bacterium]
MSQGDDFDIQAAWLRRFTSDAESNLNALALRLHEAMPALVTIHSSKGFFSRTAKTTGVTVELGDKRYRLDIAGGKLNASVAMVVRGITLSTKPVNPAEWFARLAEDTKAATADAKALSQSLAAFMGS